MFKINRYCSNSRNCFDISSEELRKNKKMFRPTGLCAGKNMKSLSPKNNL